MTNLFKIGNTNFTNPGWGTTYAWEGRIDEVAFYDHALTQAQISAHYAAR
jgi:hypothetical protein